MALPARSMLVSPLVLDVETVLMRLPAEARAQVAWTKKPIDEALIRLRTEPLTDALLASVTEQLITPLQTLWRTMWRSMVRNLDELRAALMQDFEREERHFNAFLDDDDARDTVQWVLGLLRSFYEMAFAGFAMVTPEHLEHIAEEAGMKIGEDQSMTPLLRGLIALMAASNEAQRGVDRVRAHDLLDMAFLELNAFRSAAYKQGLWFSAFPFETLDQRRERLLHYANRLRNTLSEEDWHGLKHARLQSLR